MAGKAAVALIQSRAPQLKISRHDGFVAKGVLTSGDLNYAPYERTWRGLPVVGGDFVVVTDDEGHVLATSVAQTSRIKLASTTPRVLKGRATTVARQQVNKVRNAEAPRLVVWQGKTSHLAWETRVSGRDHGHPSIQTVYVDARSGKFLSSKEHVAAGTGNGNWAGTGLSRPPAPARRTRCEPQRHHAGVPERLRQRHVHRHRRPLGQRRRHQP